MREEDPIGDMFVERFVRSTLPVRQVGGSVGTALLTLIKLEVLGVLQRPW